MIRVYLSPSQQPYNIGVGDYGDEQTAMRQLAFILAWRLTSRECEVAVARSGMSLAEVVAESNAWGAAYHVCLHSNASVRHNATGCEVFYCSGSAVGKRLAGRIYAKLCDENPAGGRRYQPTGFYELKQTDGWAVYCEIGFHDNAAEAVWITRNMPSIAKAIAAAIDEETEV